MNLRDRLTLGLKKRLPLILQTEAAECSLACLAMIAGHHGHQIDLASLRRRFPVSLKGVTLASIIDIANRIDLSARPVRLEPEDLRKLRIPCILHWRMNHFVVLKSVGTRSYYVHDPACGDRKLSADTMHENFTGVALELWPNANFQESDDRNSTKLRDLVGKVTGIAKSLCQILMLAICLEVFALVAPLFMQWVIDHALVSGNRDLLTTLAIGFGILLLMQQSISTLRSWVIMHFNTELSIQWQANVFTHLLRLPMSYFEKRHLGDIVSRFGSVQTIQTTLTTAFIESIVDGLMTVVVVVVIYLYSPLLSTICVCAMLLYGLGRWIWYRPLRLATQEQIVHAATQESHFLETVQGARTIKLFRRQDERRSGWLTLMINQVNAGLRVQKLGILYQMINGIVFGLENILVIWMGARLVLDNSLTVGMLMAFISYKRQFSGRVSALIDRFFEVKMLQIQGARLADIVMTEPEMTNADRRLVTPEGDTTDASIEVRNLYFRYSDTERYVLEDVNFSVSAGESVAIVGPSGCGKTTLLHVLLGILVPTKGEIAIGGTSIDQMETDSLRQMIASVTQNDTLFAGSIADNISFFDGFSDQKRVEEAAKLASIHDEIIAMPMAYNSLVGHMGSVLSGGQQQRVLLARALYARPSILVLDEATSHLDVQREIMVSSAIRALNVTRIIVAHRPQTAQTADRILTLVGGRIVNERRMSPVLESQEHTGHEHDGRQRLIDKIL